MKPLDYGKSFLLGRAASNEVRFWVESRTRVIDEGEGVSEDYVQCASCKSEDTFAPRDLFYEDNYDFLPIFGPEYALIFRRKAGINPDYRDTPHREKMWDGPIDHLVEGTAVLLENPAEILAATYDYTPLVAQTEIHDVETGLRAIMEYPVKTMNTRRADQAYQVDTGPIAFPDLSERPTRLVDALLPAFVAFNAPDFADFVIEAPTPLEVGHEPQIHHFSKRISLSAANRLYAVN